MKTSADSFNDLRAAERILLAQSLWDSVAEKDVLLTNDVQQELDRRLATDTAGQEKYTSWEEIKAQPQGKL